MGNDVTLIFAYMVLTMSWSGGLHDFGFDYMPFVNNCLTIWLSSLVVEIWFLVTKCCILGVPTSQPSVFQIAIKTEKDKTESKKENEREKKEKKEKREARKENEKLSATKSDVIVITLSFWEWFM